MPFCTRLSSKAYAQCTPSAAPGSATCKGTHLTTNTAFNGAYYLDGTESFGTSTYKGTTYKQYTMSLGGGDTLRICNGANIELSNATLGVIIVEKGSQILLTNSSSLSITTLSNYGTIQINSTTSIFSMNNSATIINEGIIDANNNDVRNSGKINNFGLILNVNEYSLNNSAATTCVGTGSIMYTQTIDNASANFGFTTNGGGSGCITIGSQTTGRCLTGNGAKNSNANLQFCYPANLDTSSSMNCGTSGTGFGTARHGSCTAGGASCSYPLPLTLLHFSAFKSENGVLVSWKITNQRSIHHFDVFRSGEGKDWHLIGSVLAVENDLGALHYSITDIAPLNGTNYYKLLEVNEDNVQKIAAITSISIDSDGKTDFFVYPNPSLGELNVTVVGPYDHYQLDIIDITGKILSTAQLVKGNNALGKVWTAPALYFLRMKIESNYLTKKVVVQ